MTKIKKWSLLFIFTATLFICFSLNAVIGLAQTSLVVDEDFFTKSHAKNSEIILPQAQLDGEIADVYSIAPSGLIIQGEKFVANEYGEYVVVYSSNEKEETRRLNVKSAPSSLFTISDGITLTNNVKAPSYMLDVMENMENKQKTTGLGVRVTDSKATMRYNGIINLNDISGRKINFLQMLITPKSSGIREFIGGINIKLTDVHDESNFITMNLSAHNTTSTGLFVYDKNGKEYFTKQPYLRMQSSFDGVVNQEGCLNTFTVSMDLSNDMAIYVGPYQYNGQNTLSDRYYLSREDYQKANTLKWSTGEVYLDISFGDVDKNGAEFILMSFAGLDMTSQFLETDDFHYIYDFNEGSSESDIPYGVVGFPYTVPSASGYNLVGGLAKASSLVEDEQGNIYVGNTFVPKKAGIYTVQYDCVIDGKTHNFSLPITVLDNYKAEDVFSYLIEDDKVVIGQKFVVETGDVQGGIGSVSVEKELYVNGEKAVLSVSGDNYYFVAKNINDEYVIKHTVSDYIQSFVVEQKIEVVDDKQCYFENVFVPKNVMVGRSYSILTPQVYYTENNEIKYVESKLLIDGQEKDVLNFDSVGEHVVKFVATINDVAYYSEEYRVVAYSDEAYIYDTEKNLKSYLFNFIKATNGNVDINATTHDIGVISSVDDGQDTQAMLLVPVSILDASISVKIGRAIETNYSSLNIVLNDLTGKKLTLKFSSEVLNGVYYTVIHCGEKEVARYQKVFTQSTIYATFKQDGSVYDGINYSFKTMTWDDGFAFDGFSDFVWIEVHMENVTGNSSFRFSKISNQTITDVASDRVGPSFVLKGDVPADIYIKEGETFVFPEAYAFDLLQQTGNVFITVRKLGTFVDVVDKQVLFGEYEFADMERGEYLVIFSAYEYDGNGKWGNESTIQHYIRVETVEKPTITLNGDLLKTACVGDTVKIPTATIGSFIPVEYSIYIIDADYTNKKLEGDSIKIEKAGTYIVRYIALDEDGNYTVDEYKIEAKENAQSGFGTIILIIGAMIVLAVATSTVVFIKRRRKGNEKV